MSPRSAETSDFWLRLCRSRVALSLSVRQEDIARDYGVYQSAVTKWKTGKSMPQPDLVRTMAQELGVSFEWLHMGRGEMLAGRTIDPIAAQVLEVMESLSGAAKVEVLKAAITQQTLQMPAVAARIERAQQSATKLVKSNKKAG